MRTDPATCNHGALIDGDDNCPDCGAPVIYRAAPPSDPAATFRTPSYAEEALADARARAALAATLALKEADSMVGYADDWATADAPSDALADYIAECDVDRQPALQEPTP